MSVKTRIDVFPSLANQVMVKSRVNAADKGFKLLKLKRGALKIKLHETMKQKAAVADNFHEIFGEAIFSIAKGNFLVTDFKPAAIIGSASADAWIHVTYTETIGLLLPKFEPILRKPRCLKLTGLSHGGRHVEFIRDKFQETLRTIIVIASFDYSIRALKTAIHANAVRLNGLEYVSIPRLKNTAAYIKEELEEQDREEFFRLKCSLGKRFVLQKNLVDDAMRRASEAESKAQEGSIYSEVDEEDSDDDDDEDDDENEKMQAEKLVPLPLLVFMKKKSSSAAQTIITGHFPDSQEFISPTDSLISGDFPIAIKRTPFNVSQMNVLVRQSVLPSKSGKPAKRSAKRKAKKEKKIKINDLEIEGSDTTLTARNTPSVFRLNRSDSSWSTLTTSTVSKYEVGAQTDITGRYPHRSELSLPPLYQAPVAHTAVSETTFPARKGDEEQKKQLNDDYRSD